MFKWIINFKVLETYQPKATCRCWCYPDLNQQATKRHLQDNQGIVNIFQYILALNMSFEIHIVRY